MQLSFSRLSERNHCFVRPNENMAATITTVCVCFRGYSVLYKTYLLHHRTRVLFCMQRQIGLHRYSRELLHKRGSSDVNTVIQSEKGRNVNTDVYSTTTLLAHSTSSEAPKRYCDNNTVPCGKDKILSPALFLLVSN